MSDPPSIIVLCTQNSSFHCSICPGVQQLLILLTSRTLRGQNAYRTSVMASRELFMDGFWSNQEMYDCGDGYEVDQLTASREKSRLYLQPVAERLSSGLRRV
jgi:hypothetical protein